MRKQDAFKLFIVSCMVFVFTSCKSDDYQKLLKETQINKDFAKDPPIAQDIALMFLEKPTKWGNFRMTAKLAGKFERPYLAYEADGQKVVLRDDGKGADSVKGDGIFSVFVNIDTNEVKDMISAQNASIERSNALEAEAKQFKNIMDAIRFNKKDSSASAFSHALLLSDGGFNFANRSISFDDNKPELIDVATVFRERKLIHVFPHFLCPPPPADLIQKSLMITDPTVVEDATRTWNPTTHTGNRNGVWTFNNIINQLTNKAATGISATQFVLSWLQTWDNPISLNGDIADARAAGMDQIINDWKSRSAANGLPPDTLDMAEAPVKLNAIVNRVDLRENVGYSSSNAGEARFVFSLIGSNSTQVFANSTAAFTIIFEFGINKSGCRNVQNWGQQWYDLHAMTLGSATYNGALQAITDQFVNANTSPSKPNGSSLNQVRTNDGHLIPIGHFGIGWQLREFNIDSTSHQLKLVTVKKTPRTNLNNSAFLSSFINANCAAITANNYNVPETFSGQPLLGIASNNDFSPGDAWNASITCSNPTVVREVFALNTCNGCHALETSTGFIHIEGGFASPAVPAPLSGFLTGENVNDPVSGTPLAFADLDRRAIDLQHLVCQSCRIFFPLGFRPLNMVH